MVNKMLRRLGPATVLATIALAAAAGSATAAPVAEIEFGALVPSPGGCTHASGDEGLVCNNSQTFTANGSTFTATGYSDTFVTPSALTLKPLTSPPGPPTNGFDESGLGENATGAGTACTDVSTKTDCEIGNGAAVTVTSNNPITDLIVGSAQTGETAAVYINTGSGLTLFTTVTGGSCTEYMGDAATCLVSGFSADEIGLVGKPNSGGSGTSDTLIVAVSQPAAPRPSPRAWRCSGPRWPASASFAGAVAGRLPGLILYLSVTFRGRQLRRRPLLFAPGRLSPAPRGRGPARRRSRPPDRRHPRRRAPSAAGDRRARPSIWRSPRSRRCC